MLGFDELPEWEPLEERRPSVTSVDTDLLSQGLDAKCGFENESGSNHCFLNVAIQAFWNLQSFRKRFLVVPEHLHSDTQQCHEPGALADGTGSTPCCGRNCVDSSLVGGFSGGLTAEAQEDSSSPSREVPTQAQAAVETCCFCALKKIFTQYRDAEEGTLPPDDLRKALSYVYTARNRFQLGEMEDATETIEALLDILHACHLGTPSSPCHSRRASLDAPSDAAGSELPAAVRSFAGEKVASEIADSIGRQSTLPRTASAVLAEASMAASLERVEEASDFACHPPCIAHEVFGLECVDLPRCTFCGATGEPATQSSFLYSVYVAELLATQGKPAETAVEQANPFGVVSDTVSRMTARWSGARTELQELLEKLCQRKLDSKCVECNSLQTIVSERWLMRLPYTFMISLVWPTSSPSKDMLWLILTMIQPRLRMQQIFRTHCDAKDDAYLIRGLICYYGMHYIAIFWCWSRMKWILFDDTRVREEKDWNSVATLIVSGQYVPTLLFYERGDDSDITDDITDDTNTRRRASVEELTKQVRELEERQTTCGIM